MVATPHLDLSAWHAGQAVAPPPPAPPTVLQAQLLADLQGWAVRYPIFEPAYFPALAVTVAAHLPRARREDRALVALVSLWIIAFDALVDEGDADAAVLAALAAHYGALAAAGKRTGQRIASSSGAAGQLDAALREIGSRLAAYGSSPALWAWWADSLRATIAAIVRQRELGRVAGPVPGYAAMLPLLLDSIGVRPYLAAGAIVGREPRLAARLPEVADLASECALAIRLANDLRTWQKDEFEGQINTLVALRGDLTRADRELQAAVAHKRALATLATRRTASVVRCQARLSAREGTGETEAGMVRLVAAVADIYAIDDYHTFRAYGD